MPNKRLMSVVDAAGYAMAPTEDVMSRYHDPLPDAALRNGHQSAARVITKPQTEPSSLTLHASAWTIWVRELFGFGGRAAA